MSSFHELAKKRAQYEMPLIPGSTYREKLVNGRRLAEQILLSYTDKIYIEEKQALQATSTIESYMIRNKASLEQIFNNVNQKTLPEYLVLALGSDLMQSYVLADFTRAAVGVGAWAAHEVDRLAHNPEFGMNPIQAEQDAQNRLSVFQMIIRMHQDGGLRAIFVPPDDEKGQVAIGALPVAWIIGIVAVAIVSILAFIARSIVVEQMRANNRLLEEMCTRALEEKRDAVVKECIKSRQNLQLPGDRFLKEVGEQVGVSVGSLIYLAGGVAVAYLIVTVGIPRISDHMREREREKKMEKLEERMALREGRAE